ncbi:MAG: hypothetical protein ABI791_00085 [Acidobacteriota bacterium]
MNRLNKIAILLSLLSFMTVAATIEVDAQVKRKPVIKRRVVAKRSVTPAARLYTVASGKRLHARMADTISSKTARVGDRFTATITDPVYSTNGVVVIPSGAEVIGRVDSVVPARKGGKAGTISATFIQLVLPNGFKRAINGSLTELNTDDAKSDAEGTASGDRMKHRKLIFIGGGGAGGAVLGAAVGGGKGALIGGIIGAAGGFLGDRMTKGEDAEVPSGTEFGIYLNQSISLPRFVEVNQ